MSEVVVRKLNTQNQETWRYSGKILRRSEDSLLIEAYFNREDTPFHGIVLGKGDRFVEIYFRDHWYNIFEMHDRADDNLKGWYCNVSCPAEFEEGEIAYVDLALDLLVFPDGRQLVLDEDEFAELKLDADTERKAREALKALQSIFQSPVNGRLEDGWLSV